ncbi:MAG: flagellar motor protein MotB [Elusimicrobia bacterium]|nr:flagellar motor protein MotB [Elusimicrobiota bacterium]
MADRRASDVKEGNIWTTVYSDMMTNLMMFFLMLYGLTRMPDDKKADIVKGLEKRFQGKSKLVRAEKIVKRFTDEQTESQVKELTKKEGLDAYTTVKITEKYITLTLTAPVLFTPGSAKLSDFTEKTLNEVAKILRPLTNQVIIEGHTDNTPITKGIYKSNWELSVARAYSVIEFFVKEKGLAESRFITAGYGEYRPVADNNTNEGKAKNRRIEIVMIR